MKKILLIIGLVLLFSFIEFFLFNLIGRWIVPHLLILLIIFFDYYLGIRYSLFTAAAAGILMDSFSVNLFGANFLSFIVCAFMATVLRRYFYDVQGGTSRLLFVFLLLLIDFFTHYVLYLFMGEVNLFTAVQYILLPQVIVTLFVANFTFYQLKRCVSRFSI